ncbi:MAG: site-specific integrase [Planctomycetes bacterium]|nr:site-specific integrase [Planctomycetota bacterium]
MADEIPPKPQRRQRRAFGTIFLRGRIWTARWQERGRTRTKAIGPTKGLAQRFLAKKETDLAIAEAMGIRPLDAIRFEDFLKDLPAACRGKKSSITVLRELEFLNAVAVPVFRGRLLSDIQREDIERFVSKRMQDRDLSPGTRNRYLSILSALFREALLRNHVRENPCRGIPRGKEARREPPFLDLPAQAHLVSVFEPPLRNAVLLTLDTGLRLGELLRLDWRDIDLERKALTVRVSKNRTPRTVPFTSRGLEGLLDQRRLRGAHPATVPDPVFRELNRPSRRGEPDFVPGFRKEWVAGRARAGHPTLRWHDMRHVFATTAARAGVPLGDLARLLGHGSMVMVSRYAAHVPANFTDLARDRLEALLRIAP